MINKAFVFAGAIALGSNVAGAAQFDCVIVPAVVVNVGSPVSGLIDEVLVNVGDRVEPNQVIARLRTDVEQKTLQLLALQANNPAEVEAQESRLDLALKRLERVTELVASEVLPREQLDAAEAEAQVIQNELSIALMRQQAAKLEYERAEVQIEQRVIRSPLSGIITARNLYNGEFLSADSSVVTIAQIDPLHVQAFLPVRYSTQVSVGAELEVRPDAPLEGAYPAKVEVIDRVFDAGSGTFGLQLLLANPEEKIPAGHRCQMELPE